MRQNTNISKLQSVLGHT